MRAHFAAFCIAGIKPVAGIMGFSRYASQTFSFFNFSNTLLCQTYNVHENQKDGQNQCMLFTHFTGKVGTLMGCEDILVVETWC